MKQIPELEKSRDYACRDLEHRFKLKGNLARNSSAVKKKESIGISHCFTGKEMKHLLEF